MKKLLLILICLFVSSEAKSKYIALECEVKKKLYRITDSEGLFKKNILDTSFDLITLYFDEKNQWLNDSKIDKEFRNKIKFNKKKSMMTIEDEDAPDWKWRLDDEGDTYRYVLENSFYQGSLIKSLYIDLNKDSGFFRYSVTYDYPNDFNLYDSPSYSRKLYSDGYSSSGVCKKIKKSLF